MMKPVSRESLQTKIDRLAEHWTPSLRDAFLSSIADITDTVVLSDFIDAIVAGDPERAIRVLGLDDTAMRALSSGVEDAFEAGAMTTMSDFPASVIGSAGGTRAIFRFDVRNSRAEAWLRDHSSSLVTRIMDEQRTLVRVALNSGLKAGTNPRVTALDIVGRMDPVLGQRVGGIIGLSGPQSTAISNMRRELASGDPDQMSNYFNRERRDKRFDGTVQRAIDNGTAVDNTTISKLAGRYSDNLLDLRGETIARTETISALNQAQDETFQQAVENGSIQQSAVQREWDATHDGRTREAHAEMDGQKRGLNDPFLSPTGAQMMYPGDASLGAEGEDIINCRCRVKFNVDYFAGVK